MPKMALYRFCIEQGLLDRDRIAQTTFYRFIREYGLLAPPEEDHKKRLAFSMKYANQLWQADTMFGPFVDTGVPGPARQQAKLIAFIDDASRYVLSWRLSNTLEVDFCLDALDDALRGGRPEIFNTDQGSQYTAEAFVSRVTASGSADEHGRPAPLAG